MADFPPSEVRLSEVARGCDRMSVLRATGAQADEPDGEQKEWFARGHLFESYVVRQLVATFGEDDVERQVEIHHPLGVGHADAYIRSRRQIVEIKSTQAGTLSTPVYENGVKQVKLYIHFHPEAESGLLYMVNPSTLRPAEAYDIALTDEDRVEIDVQIERIRQGIDHPKTGMPDRVCSYPGQARGMFCSFAFDCFQGWTPPDPYVTDDPAVIAAAARLNQIGDEEFQHKLVLKSLEQEREEAKAALAQAVPEGFSNVGPFRVKKWRVKGRKSFQYKAYDAAGISDPVVEQFTALSEGHDRITVEQIAAADATAVDYGDVPFE
jgi:hypothetical protein